MVSLCKKSFLILLILKCSRDSLVFAFSRFLEPFCFRLKLFDSRFNLLSLAFNGLGAWIFSPFDKVARSVMPKSIPTCLSVLGCGLMMSCNSAATDTNHLPPCLKILADNILPCIRDFYAFAVYSKLVVG